jgi:hypothetical protein
MESAPFMEDDCFNILTQTNGDEYIMNSRTSITLFPNMDKYYRLCHALTSLGALSTHVAMLNTSFTKTFDRPQSR